MKQLDKRKSCQSVVQILELHVYEAVILTNCFKADTPFKTAFLFFFRVSFKGIHFHIWNMDIGSQRVLMREAFNIAVMFMSWFLTEKVCFIYAFCSNSCLFFCI